MSTDTDHDIRRLLDDVATPDHRAGFWDQLRDQLDDGAGRGPHARSETRVTRSGASRRWLAAAAVVLAVLVGVGTFLATENDSVDVTSEPRVVAPPTTQPPDEGALRPADAPTRSSGQVVAVSPDGEWLYSLDDDPSGEIGCDGYPRQRLYVEPAAGPVGEGRRPALDEPMEAWTTLAFGPEGSVALVARCEESLTSVRAGVIAGDGGILVRDWDLGDRWASIVDLAWRSPTQLVVSTSGLGPVGQGPDGRGLYEVDAVTGEIGALEPDGVMYVEVTSAGQLVTRDNVGAIRVGEELVGSEGQVNGLVVSDDGRFVITTGGAGVTVYDLRTAASERIWTEPAFDASFLRTGDVVFHTRRDGVGQVVAVRLGEVGSGLHPSATLFSDQGVGRLTYSAVAPDGSRLWVSYLPAQSDGEPRPVLLAQTLAR